MTMPSGAVRRHVACSNCRARKLRCEFSPGTNACRRCAGSGRADECVVQESHTRTSRAKRTPPADHQEVSQSQYGTKEHRPVQPVTTHSTNRRAKRQHHWKSKSREREADTRTRVMPAHDVPLDPILESEDDCDSDAVDDRIVEICRALIGSNDKETDEYESASDEDTDTDTSSSDTDAVDSRQDKLAEFLRLLMIGSNDEETDKYESGSDEDTDTDASSSDTDDGDSSSEESAEDTMQFLHWQRHPKLTVSQASVDQEWQPGMPKGKLVLAEPKSASAYNPQMHCKSIP